MEAQLKGAVLIALVVVPQWRCPILKPHSAKLPPKSPKSETAPHPGWQDGTILEPGFQLPPIRPSSYLQYTSVKQSFSLLDEQANSFEGRHIGLSVLATKQVLFRTEKLFGCWQGVGGIWAKSFGRFIPKISSLMMR